MLNNDVVCWSNTCFNFGCWTIAFWLKLSSLIVKILELENNYTLCLFDGYSIPTRTVQRFLSGAVKLLRAFQTQNLLLNEIEEAS